MNTRIFFKAGIKIDPSSEICKFAQHPPNIHNAYNGLRVLYELKFYGSPS